MLYVLVESFWRYLDRTSAIWAALSGNSYGVYLIHVIVIGVFGTLLLRVDLPAVAKYLLLIVSVYGASNLLVSAYRSVRRALTPRGAGANA